MRKLLLIDNNGNEIAGFDLTNNDVYDCLDIEVPALIYAGKTYQYEDTDGYTWWRWREVRTFHLNPENGGILTNAADPSNVIGG